MTSHDVVATVRRIMRTRKVGHAGTLDPMATGVLVLGIERATKLLGHLALSTKSYSATIVLGIATSTDDAEGEPLSTVDATGLHSEAIAAEIAALTGEIRQRPSAVSAIKVNGVRSYARVRSGQQVELAARPVTVSRFDLHALRRHGQRIELDVVVCCSSGTYVRALARDLGAALGVGGHLSALRRGEVGPFTLANATTLVELEADPAVSLDLAAALRTAFHVRVIDAAAVRALGVGQRIPAAGIAGVYGALDESGKPIALLQESGAGARSVVLLDLGRAG